MLVFGCRRRAWQAPSAQARVGNAGGVHGEASLGVSGRGIPCGRSVPRRDPPVRGVLSPLPACAYVAVRVRAPGHLRAIAPCRPASGSCGRALPMRRELRDSCEQHGAKLVTPLAADVQRRAGVKHRQRPVAFVHVPAARGQRGLRLAGEITPDDQHSTLRLALPVPLAQVDAFGEIRGPLVCHHPHWPVRAGSQRELAECCIDSQALVDTNDPAAPGFCFVVPWPAWVSSTCADAGRSLIGLHTPSEQAPRSFSPGPTARSASRWRSRPPTSPLSATHSQRTTPSNPQSRCEPPVRTASGRPTKSPSPSPTANPAGFL